jgi:hypothetical protein
MIFVEVIESTKDKYTLSMFRLPYVHSPSCMVTGEEMRCAVEMFAFIFDFVFVCGSLSGNILNSAMSNSRSVRANSKFVRQTYIDSRMRDMS